MSPLAMQPRVLKLVVGGLALIGTVLLLVFLTKALHPAKKPPKLPSVDVTTLGVGHHMTLSTESLRYFVVRTMAGEVHVVAAPTESGTVLMPDIHWWRPVMNCKDFGLNAVGVDADAARFRCRDRDQPEAWSQHWQWDIYGKHIAASGKKIDNLYRVRIQRTGQQVTFVALESD